VKFNILLLNHTEPDHSGSLRLLLEIAPLATVVGSGSAIRYLEDMVNVPFKSLVVKDGDTLDLGNKTLRFISAPNCTGPIQFSLISRRGKDPFHMRSFGAHYCGEEMYSTSQLNTWRHININSM